MNRCVRHETINKDGKLYMLCRWCWEVKELSSEFRWKDSGSKTWYVYRCKECMRPIQRELNKKSYYKDIDRTKRLQKLYREKNREKIRLQRRKRYEKENIKRRERMHDIVKKNVAHVKEMGYWPIHRMTCYRIKKLWIRPSKCPICWYEWRIVAHHPDYNHRYEIIFCCGSCHTLIHQWKIDVSKLDLVVLKE